MVLPSFKLWCVINWGAEVSVFNWLPVDLLPVFVVFLGFWISCMYALAMKMKLLIHSTAICIVGQVSVARVRFSDFLDATYLCSRLSAPFGFNYCNFWPIVWMEQLRDNFCHNFTIFSFSLWRVSSIFKIIFVAKTLINCLSGLTPFQFWDTINLLYNVVKIWNYFVVLKEGE